MKNYFLKLFIYITFIISLFLQMLFIQNNHIILHISWLILTLIYWIIKYPYIINIITSFFIGLVIDFFLNYILGVHSLLLCILTYLISYNYQLIINLHIINKFFFIIYVTFIINGIIYYINNINYNYLELLLQSILNSCIWLIIYFYIEKIYHKCQKYFF
ncbi:rod shape-determining protein MreD [Enterobacteriaceae endosymbiont of Donacia cinerea]|uniref:rod shape-determining protein MreD n=1 Tax=Enterobacteriaceae endosymbiont of Donacia cinerea TaxID=2675774 RepID=UPI0014491103|nr:rod shape-determining protein MreD [Enterobacteriaceae endosymbiont of Donacia cinerea]QJC33922.1 rod shape-determining protein MreD [Enterobacteriaceae endosymbiont of Donacia cinerea]